MRMLAVAIMCTALLGYSRVAAEGRRAPAETQGRAPAGTQGRADGVTALPIDLEGHNVHLETVAERPASDESAGGRRATVLSDMGDHLFVDQAARHDMAQIEMGALAARQASSPALRQLGQHRVDDHTKADAALRQLAEEEHFGLPLGLSPAQEQKIAALAAKSGAAFDRSYVAALASEDEHALDVFRHEAKRASADDGVQAWARQMLPMIERHAQSARQQAQALKRAN